MRTEFTNLEGQIGVCMEFLELNVDQNWILMKDILCVGRTLYFNLTIPGIHSLYIAFPCFVLCIRLVWKYDLIFLHFCYMFMRKSTGVDKNSTGIS